MSEKQRTTRPSPFAALPFDPGWPAVLARSSADPFCPLAIGMPTT